MRFTSDLQLKSRQSSWRTREEHSVTVHESVDQDFGRYEREIDSGTFIRIGEDEDSFCPLERML